MTIITRQKIHKKITDSLLCVSSRTVGNLEKSRSRAMQREGMETAKSVRHCWFPQSFYFEGYYVRRMGRCRRTIEEWGTIDVFQRKLGMGYVRCYFSVRERKTLCVRGNPKYPFSFSISDCTNWKNLHSGAIINISMNIVMYGIKYCLSQAQGLKLVW